MRPGTNADFPWDMLEPAVYFAHNYARLRDDDRAIIRRVRDFFAGAGIAPGSQGIDVGTGANLYPPMAMLPFCAAIELREFSGSGVAWLTWQVADFDPAWDPFWKVLADSPAYRAVSDPRAALAERANVVKASVFDLPRGRWDMGTMFFVACSLSTRREEFNAAVTCFVRCLKPSAPFAAAFMAHSHGYVVNDILFPAVSVGEDDVRGCLARVAYDVVVETISSRSLRDGYSGMILAMGRARPAM